MLQLERNAAAFADALSSMRTKAAPVPNEAEWERISLSPISLIVAQTCKPGAEIDCTQQSQHSAAKEKKVAK